MNISLNVSNRSLNKREEELCGDTVEVIHTADSDIVILSDGMGSGVKANILSTLTTKILGTMLKNGESIDDCVETIAMTLPICSVRQVAYSTFSILQIYKDGRANLVEYDTPSCLVFRDGKRMELPYVEREIAGKSIREYDFVTMEGDCFIMMTDGVTHAGVGGEYSFGWGHKRVGEYAAEIFDHEGAELSCARVTTAIIDECSRLYNGIAGDDTTIVTAKVTERHDINLFTGPPTHKEDDARVVREFMESPGLHIISGGTSATIVARELGREIIPSLFYDDPDIPPTAEIEGLDLVTEGVLTLNRAVNLLHEYNKGDQDRRYFAALDAENGGSQLAKLLIERGTHIHLFVGEAMNPAHQAAGLPFDLSIRMRLVDRIAQECRLMGKEVNVSYY